MHQADMQRTTGHREPSYHQPSSDKSRGWTYACKALTTIPIILPKQAPTAMEGTKIPQGTLQPYEMMINPIRMIVASSSELTIFHCSDDLSLASITPYMSVNSLTKTVMITSALAFSE